MEGVHLVARVLCLCSAVDQSNRRLSNGPRSLSDSIPFQLGRVIIQELGRYQSACRSAAGSHQAVMASQPPLGKSNPLHRSSASRPTCRQTGSRQPIYDVRGASQIICIPWRGNGGGKRNTSPRPDGTSAARVGRENGCPAISQVSVY